MMNGGPRPKRFQLPYISTIKRGPVLSEWHSFIQIRAEVQAPGTATATAMPRRHTPLLIIILLMFLFVQMSSGHGGGTQVGSSVHGSLLAKIRKVLVETQDYDYGGPNTRHDPPRKGKPGSGGKNP